MARKAVVLDTFGAQVEVDGDSVGLARGLYSSKRGGVASVPLQIQDARMVRQPPTAVLATVITTKLQVSSK